MPPHEVAVRHWLVWLERPRVHGLVPDVLILVGQGDGGGCHPECTPHTPPAVVFVVILASRVHEGEVQRRTFVPPALLLGNGKYVGRQNEIVLVRGVDLSDRVHVRHHGHVGVGKPLGSPDRAGACWVRQDLEGPGLVLVAHDERLPRPLEGVWRSVEAVLGGEVAHQLNGVARGGGPLHGQLREGVDAHQGHADLPARLAADGGARAASSKHGAAGRLRHGDAVLVEDAIGTVLVAVGVGHLVNVADGLHDVRPRVSVRLIVGTERGADIPWEVLWGVVDRPLGPRGVVCRRHVDQPGVVRGGPIVRVGDDDGAVCRGLLPGGEDGASAGAAEASPED
mmetsp:Transcript_24405/g.66621  ORF Transcript_24405/g.66621 Transcript_24405/m.66621 type:complete len:339 (+) Transcript_24405:760-1776(+)